MNITLASYLDKVEFCIVACSKLLPHVQDMLKLIEEELVVLEKLSEDKRLGVLEFNPLTM